MVTPRAVARAVLAGAALACASCGYTFGPRAPEGTKTVAIPSLRNRTVPLRRGIENRVTRALHREMRTGTGLIMATSESDADIVLHGEVMRVDESVLAEGFISDVPEDIRVSVTVHVRATARDGKPLLDRNFTQVADTALSGGGTRDVALERVFRRLARDISRALGAGE